MRELHATLAGLACWEASWRLGPHDYSTAGEAVRRLVTQAIRHLGARALVRDPRQIWRPVLGASDTPPLEGVSAALRGPQ
jgi:hypothetical protein